MRGVDRADQLREYYSVGRASYKWYRYIFSYLINTPICNSFILRNFHRLRKGMGKLRQLNFRTKLAKQLIGGFSSTSSAAQWSKRRKIEAFALQPGNAGRHFQTK